MELFPALTKFYEAIEDDVRINSTHISVYMALLQEWNVHEGKNPINTHREKIMKSAKINARQTYNSCMNNLQEFGYINYQPSTNQFEPSIIYLRGL